MKRLRVWWWERVWSVAHRSEGCVERVWNRAARELDSLGLRLVERRRWVKRDPDR